MRAYLLTIIMGDGSRGICHGQFPDDWTAIDAMFAAFHDARRVAARRLA